ncbi:NUDIX domain protein [Posidoniimonas corsicana]|uniref:NUDIX domain protein n=1 Tax=Posidoniimonas corsicana TaxID=1938618 RepID=A0A5C5VE38_9BACT|nr:NUDIX hydrolase [Posidoniimonas corsicana]TWT36886.1 NUDIX domain protein [Posidoniimonas corsicana]
MASRPDWCFNQAGGLPYFDEAGQPRVVLVTSRSAKKWIFPKGIIDPGETDRTTAQKEALEEAGVIGSVVGDALGSYEQAKWGGVAQITIFPLLCTSVLDDWEDFGARQRQVLSLEDAIKIVHEPLRPVLQELERALADGAVPIQPLR